MEFSCPNHLTTHHLTAEQKLNEKEISKLSLDMQKGPAITKSTPANHDPEAFKQRHFVIISKNPGGHERL